MFKRVYLFCLLLITIFFCGLRFYTGADWSGYIEYFETASWENDLYEPGYKLLNVLCKIIFQNYYFVQFLASVFYVVSVFYFCRKNTKHYFTAIMLSILFSFEGLLMSQVRQSIAISILLLGSNYLFYYKTLQRNYNTKNIQGVIEKLGNVEKLGRLSMILEVMK